MDKKMLSVCLSLLLAVGLFFTSCSSGGGGGVAANSIVGAWKSDSTQGGDGDWIATVRGNGTVSVYYPNIPATLTGTYVYDKGQKILTSTLLYEGELAAVLVWTDVTFVNNNKVTYRTDGYIYSLLRQ